MNKAPVLFISHGSPMRVVENTPVNHFLSNLANRLPPIKGILIISPHWETRDMRYTQKSQLGIIYDFWGFPDELYQVRYRTHNPNWLQTALVNSLSKEVLSPDSRDLDHGAWSILYLLYPEAEVPVIGLSLPIDASLNELYRLGHQLKDLREKGIMIIASGMATHNLSLLSRNGAPHDWAKSFVGWLQKKVSSKDIDHLLNYRQIAPFAEVAHPRDEHLRPLFIALGATGMEEESALLHESWEYGSGNNSCWGWGL